MKHTPLSVILYGISGSGKGTQAHILKEYLESRGDSVLYIETGDRLRQFAQKEGHTETMARDAMNRGGLLPSFLPVHLWTEALIKEFSGTESLILDGLARRQPEAPILDGALWFYGRGEYQIIEFTLSSDVARARLMERNRGDDASVESIDRRFAWYVENVAPAIEYFEKVGRPVHHIDANRSIEEIHAEVLARLGLSS